MKLFKSLWDDHVEAQEASESDRKLITELHKIMFAGSK